MPIDPDRYYQLVGRVEEGSRIYDLLHHCGATRRCLLAKGLGEYLYIPHLLGDDEPSQQSFVYGVLPPRKQPRKAKP